MKVKRYHTGQQVVGKLKEQRSRMLSPEEAGQAAGAKYNMIADVADTASQAVQEYDATVKKREAETDATQAALDMDNYQAEYQRMVKQAETENWTDEQFRSNAEALNKTLKDSLGMISERNRGEIEKAYRTTIGQMGVVTSDIAHGLKRKQQVSKVNERYQQALQEKDYASMEHLDKLALNNKWINQAEFDKRQRSHAEMQTVDGMIEEYKGLDDEQKRADFMARVPGSGLSDEAQRSLVSDVDFYNKTQKEQRAIFEEQEQEAKDRISVDFERTLAANPFEFAGKKGDDELHAFADKMDYTKAQRGALFNIRDRGLETVGTVDQLVPDKSSAKYTKAVDAMSMQATQTTDPMTNVMWQINNANTDFTLPNGETRTIGALGDAARATFNNATLNQDEFIAMLPAYEHLMRVAPNVHHGFDSETELMFKTALELSKGDPKAAERIWTTFDNASEQDYKDAADSFDPDMFWAGMDAVGAEAGLVWEDEGFAWFDITAPVDPVARAKLERAGKAYYAYHTLAAGGQDYNAVRRNTASYASQIMGMTNINRGVPVNDVVTIEDGEPVTHTRLDTQIMSNPVCRSKEECDKARAIHTGDMVGKKVLINGVSHTIVDAMDYSPELAPLPGMGIPAEFDQIHSGKRTIPVNHIEIFSTPTERVDKYGNTVWGQRYKGQVLINPETKNVYDWNTQLSPEEKRALANGEDVSGTPEDEPKPIGFWETVRRGTRGRLGN